MKFTNLLVAVLLTIILFFGCKKEIVEDVKFPRPLMDSGKVENNIYMNNFFKLKFPLLDGWRISNDLFEKEIPTPYSYFKKDSNIGITIKNLILATKDSPKNSYIENPGFLVSAVSIQNIGENTEDVLNSVIDKKREAVGVIDSSKKYEKIKFGEYIFKTGYIKFKFNGKEIHQQFYGSIMNNYCLIFSFFSYNKKQTKEFQEHLENISIEKIFYENTEIFYSWVQGTRVRKSPGLGQDVIDNLEEGEAVTWSGKSSEEKAEITLRGKTFNTNFYLVNLKNGKSGWVYAGTLISEDEYEKQKTH